MFAGLIAAALGIAACSGAAATPSGQPAASALPAGTYTAKAFKPPLTYTVPAGWANPSDSADYFEIRPAQSDVVGIYVFGGPLAASQDKACPDQAETGVGTSSTALSTWIRSLSGLKVSSPRLASVGGLRGTELDVEIADGWTASCPYAQGVPSVALLQGRNASFRWTVAGNEKLRLDLLDGPDQTTIVIDIDAFEGSLFDDLLVAATPIVRSFSFKTG